MTAQGAATADVQLHRVTRAPRTRHGDRPRDPARDAAADVARKFRAEFTRRFGFAAPEDAPQVATLRVEVVVAGERRRRAIAARHGDPVVRAERA